MTRMESQQIKSKGGSPEEHPDRPPQSYCIVFCIIIHISINSYHSICCVNVWTGWMDRTAYTTLCENACGK